MFILQYGAIKIRNNICHINPYKYDTNIEDIKSENADDGANVLSPVIYFYIILKLAQKFYIQILAGALSVESNPHY